MDAGLDHFLGILGLWALANRLAFLKSDLFLERVFVMETDSLVESHRLLVLVLNLIIHTLVLVTVIAHLVPAFVLLGSIGL